MIRSGCVVIYRSGAALVTGCTDGKFSIITASGDSKNVREKDLAFLLHPGPAQRVPEAAEPPADWTASLELIEGESLTFAEFAEFVFGTYTPETALGAWDIIESGIYVSFDGSRVRLRPAAEIEASLAAIREKQEARRRHEELVARIRSGTILPEDRPALAEIEAVALGRTAASRLMKEIGLEALPEKAHKLLLRLGVWKPEFDPFPARAGVSMEDPAFTLPEEDAEEDRTDLTHLAAYAIDDETSGDPDDAISWEDGLLYVHTADPASCLTFGGEADLEARERGENLYLPEKVVHMLPPEATARFGLGLRPVNAALTFVIRFADSGKPELERVLLSRVAVRRLTYDTAAPVLADPAFAPLHDALARFRNFRAERGALFIRLPEVKIIADGSEEIRFIPTPVTPEREFVANAMLAAGAATAEWADRNGIPLPFVRQEEPDDPPEPGDSLPAMYALRRACRPGTTDTIPGPHAGLGLDPYTRVTSPLRRYADLLAHMQLHRYLRGGELLDTDALDEALRVSEAAALTRRKLERLVNEYWTLLHFSRHQKDLSTAAQAVFRQDDRCFFLLPEFAYEYRTRFRARPGECFRAEILSCDPPGFSLRLKLTPDAGGEACESESDIPENI